MKILRRVLLGLGALALLAGAAGLFAIWYVGAWGIVFPSRHHDEVAPALPAGFGDGAGPAVLVFSKTNSFRHKAAIPAGAELLESLVTRRGGTFFHTENGAVFDAALLADVDVVVFHNASGDMLSEAQEAAFVTWLEAGGGWIGIHAAGDSSHREWAWYQDTLIGGLFVGHTIDPHIQEALLIVEDAEHPATRALPREYRHAEEWYAWDASARTKGMHVLVRVDESSYTPGENVPGRPGSLAMGDDHPVVWSRCVGRGRAFYSALGHEAEAFATDEYPKMLDGAIAWAARLEGLGCDGA